ALLHDERREPETTDRAAVLMEVLGGERPGTGGVALGGVEAEPDDEKRGLELAHRFEGARERPAVLRSILVLGQRKVQVEAFAGPLAAFVGEAGEIRIGERGIDVDRNGEHVGAIVEDLLLTVAVVIVDVEDGDLAVLAEVLGRDRTAVEIAESTERAPFRV